MRTFSFQRIGEYKESDQAKTMAARDYKDATDLVTKMKNEGSDEMAETTVVRRLTELECERLQGFPDNWTLVGEADENGEHYWTDSTGKRKKVTSSARYKALGNSIALPFWRYLARRIMAQYEKKDVTMGSLFDGISGFPLVFKECGCEPRWSSEIEEFPIAVCKQHFGDEETGQEGDIAKYL